MNLLSNILLLDDNKMDSYMNEEIIRRQVPSGSIMTLHCPQEAIEYIKSITIDSSYNLKNFLPDLIFLDVNMPKMNGFDVLDELKELNIFKKKQIDVFFLSSSTCEKDIKHALDHQLSKGYIKKPLNKDKLAKVLKLNILSYYTPKNKQSSLQKQVLL